MLDINHRGANDLFVGEGDGGFRVLLNTNGTFQPQGEPVLGKPGVVHWTGEAIMDWYRNQVPECSPSPLGEA